MNTPFQKPALTFRPLAPDDLSLMHRWLHMDQVLRWWKERLTYEEVVAKYSPRLTGEEPTQSYVILMDQIPIGYIQTYCIADYPDYAACVQVEEKTAGVDLFIGEAEYLYKGLGSEILRLFLSDIVFQSPSVSSCVLGPEPSNTAAIRCYQKAGFRYLKTVQCPDEDAPEYLMKIIREAVLPSNT